MKDEKPSIETVVEYAQKQVRNYIIKLASTLPLEQREEISQDAMVRVIEAYERLDKSKGWKSFVQLHCYGTVIDYMRSCSGFEEVSVRKTQGESRPKRLRNRVQFTHNESGDRVDLETTLGLFGVFDEQPELTAFKPKWPLIARMARQDMDVHLVAKLLLGFTQTELSGMFKVTRECLTQRLQDFCEQLNSPALLHSRWVAQTIYAFGLCHLFNQPEIDLGFGWEYDPVDLFQKDINYIESLDPQQEMNFN